MNFRARRRSGILLHPTALPGPHGIGDIGPHAYRFVDHLSDMSQSLWQILPIGPTDFQNSPYSSISTFAGNHLLISLDLLVEDGLLDSKFLDNYKQHNQYTNRQHNYQNTNRQPLCNNDDNFNNTV